MTERSKEARLKELIAKLGKEKRWDLIDALYFPPAWELKEDLAIKYGRNGKEIMAEAKKKFKNVGLKWEDLSDRDFREHLKELVDKEKEISERRKEKLAEKIKRQPSKLKKIVYVFSVQFADGGIYTPKSFSYPCSLVVSLDEEEIVKSCVKLGLGFRGYYSTRAYKHETWEIPPYAEGVLRKIRKNPSEYKIALKDPIVTLRRIYEEEAFQYFQKELKNLEFIPCSDLEKFQDSFNEKFGKDKFEEICQSLLKTGSLVINYYSHRKRAGRRRSLPPRFDFSLTNEGKEILNGLKKRKEQKRKVKIKDGALFFGQKNQWRPFQELIAIADEKVEIITSTLSPEGLEKILKRKKKDVKMKFLYSRVRGKKGYKKLSNLKSIDFRKKAKRFKHFHGKLCIADGKKVLLGSSNITKRGLGIDISGPIQADMVFEDKGEDKGVVSETQLLFNIIWKRKKNIKELDTDSNFISSAYGIPKKIKELFKGAKEVIIIVPPLFEYADRILDYLTEKNQGVNIKLITHYQIPKNYIETVEKIREMENVEFIPVRTYIHSKVYLFDQKTALISSLNLELTSWCYSLETGVITHNRETIDKIVTKIGKLKEKKTKIKEDSKRKWPKSLHKAPKAFDLPFETEGKRFHIDEKILSKNKAKEKRKIAERVPKVEKEIEKKRIPSAKKRSLHHELEYIDESPASDVSKSQEKLEKIEKEIKPQKIVWRKFGKINNVRRGRPKHYIVKPESKPLSKFIGKKVRWKTEGGKYILGKVVRLHGKHSVRVILKRGLPGQAIATYLEYKEE